MFKNKLFLCGVVAIAIVFNVSCSNRNNESDYAQMTTFAMDTVISFTVDTPNNSDVFTQAEKIIRDYENIFSVTIENSDIYKLNNSNVGEKINVSSETMDILKISKELTDITDDTFSVAIAPLVSLWGFTQDIEQVVPNIEDIEKTIDLINWSDISIDENNNTVEFLKDGMSVDLGGIAKGYVAEEVTEFLRSEGIENGHFTIGGNISTMGLKKDGSKWRIAVQDPLDADNYVGVLEVSDVYIVTSGGYQRYFTEDGIDYHHIIDKETGYPSNSGLLSVTIISEDGTQADALSTALFVMGLDKSLEFWKNNKNFEAVFVTADEVVITSGAEEFFKFENHGNDFQYSIVY